MPDKKLTCIILAAGQSKRMKSSRSKALHEICGKALLEHVVDTLRKLEPERIVAVVSPETPEVVEFATSIGIETCYQHERLGTGHAALQAEELLGGFDGTILLSSVAPCGAPDFCFGDGGDQMGCTDCPCANNAAPGSGGGCINSAGTSAVLTSAGGGSVSLPNLCFAMSGGNPSSFAILTSGAARAPNSVTNPCFGQNPGSGIQSISLDGLRCVVLNVLRHGSRAVDSNGDIGLTTNSWGACSPTFPNS